MYAFPFMRAGVETNPDPCDLLRRQSRIPLSPCWLREGLDDFFTTPDELDRMRFAAKVDWMFGKVVDFAPVGAVVGDDRHESAPCFGNKAVCDFRAARELPGYGLRLETGTLELQWHDAEVMVRPMIRADEQIVAPRPSRRRSGTIHVDEMKRTRNGGQIHLAALLLAFLAQASGIDGHLVKGGRHVRC